MDKTKISFPFVLEEINGYNRLERLMFEHNQNKNRDNRWEIVNEILQLVLDYKGMKVILPTKSTYIEKENVSWILHELRAKDGSRWIPVFTSKKEADKAPPTDVVPTSITVLFELLIKDDVFAGIVINAFGDAFMLNKKMAEYILNELKLRQ